ncbi:MAG: motility associated factor glycosyltransferase family protein [bacterium]
MPDSLRSANLHALARRFPGLVRLCHDDPAPPFSLSLVMDPTAGPWPAVWLEQAGRKRFLHSRHDPVKEARRWAAAQPPPVDSVALLFGWGLGYHAVEWIRRYGGQAAAVIVFEPEPALFTASLDWIDARGLAEHPRAAVVPGPDRNRLYEALYGMLDLLMSRELRIVPMPFADIYPPAITRMLREEIGKLVAAREGALRHMETLGYRCQENLIGNIPAMFSSWLPRDVRDRLKNQPALIVAAGPSLDRNIVQLRSVRGRAWIFAVDTIWRVLLEYGIDARFVVTKDPTTRNLRHFEGIASPAPPCLVFDPQVDPAIPKTFTGGRILMPNRNHALHARLPGLELDARDLLPPSTNVALAAFNMAVAMGCDPVIFAGLDLCFARAEGVSHARGTALASRTAFAENEGVLHYQQGEVQEAVPVLEVEGIDGRRYPTTPNFHEALRLLESLIPNAPVHCVDASEGGARVAGTEILPLSRALETYCGKLIDPSDFPPPAPRRDPRPTAAALSKIADHIAARGALAGQGTRYLTSHPQSPDRAELERLRDAIEEGDWIYHALQAALERVVVEIDRPGFWRLPPGEALWERYAWYFGEIERACGAFGPIFRKTAREIRMDSSGAI